MSQRFLTAVSPLPQLIKSAKSKSTPDISLTTLLFLLLLLVLWTAYGIYLRDLHLIMGDLAGAVIVLAIIALKLKYG